MKKKREKKLRVYVFIPVVLVPVVLDMVMVVVVAVLLVVVLVMVVVEMVVVVLVRDVVVLLIVVDVPVVDVSVAVVLLIVVDVPVVDVSVTVVLVCVLVVVDEVEVMVVLRHASHSTGQFSVTPTPIISLMQSFLRNSEQGSPSGMPLHVVMSGPFNTAKSSMASSSSSTMSREVVEAFVTTWSHVLHNTGHFAAITSATPGRVDWQVSAFPVHDSSSGMPLHLVASGVVLVAVGSVPMQEPHSTGHLSLRSCATPCNVEVQSSAWSAQLSGSGTPLQVLGACVVSEHALHIIGQSRATTAATPTTVLVHKASCPEHVIKSETVHGVF